MNELTGHYQKKIHKRTIILSSFFFLWFIVLSLRLVQLQVIEHKSLRAAAESQNKRKHEIVPERGTIYDRHGQIMARSLPVPSVFFVPSEKEPPAAQFDKVARLRSVLELSSKDLLRIRAKIQDGDTFIYLKRKTTPEIADRVKSQGIQGIGFEEEHKRFYPLGTQAAHVLGAVNMDNVGASGVELQYDALLQGEKGQSLILQDAKKKRYHWEVLKKPLPGRDLSLTIDNTIQYISERELENAVLEQKAAWGTVVVSVPSSGEILAMATYPTYDPNEWPPSPYEISSNRAIQENFEPGSTFKIITACAARENGAVNFGDIFDCSEGKIRVGGWTISDHKKLGVLTFSEVIIHSSNVGTVMVGKRLGEASLFRMIQAFHFGRPTGIDLPGEEKGILHSLPEWYASSLASHSIGYGISVTAIQILQAMNVIANGGLFVPPRIAEVAPDMAGGRPSVPAGGERIISERTAKELIHRIFEKVVLEGTGQEAQINGFTVAGKTGTAQKRDPSGGYTGSRHMASFVGFVPADNPAISIIVVIDDPRVGLHYGGTTAAPVFREIARHVLLYLGQTPDYDPTQKIITAKLRSQPRP
jgi:cell division protein FtsI (penicillin-binding protein 3)